MDVLDELYELATTRGGTFAESLKSCGQDQIKRTAIMLCGVSLLESIRSKAPSGLCEGMLRSKQNTDTLHRLAKLAPQVPTPGAGGDYSDYLHRYLSKDVDMEARPKHKPAAAAAETTTTTTTTTTAVTTAPAATATPTSTTIRIGSITGGIGICMPGSVTIFSSIKPAGGGKARRVSPPITDANMDVATEIYQLKFDVLFAAIYDGKYSVSALHPFAHSLLAFGETTKDRALCSYEARDTVAEWVEKISKLQDQYNATVLDAFPSARLGDGCEFLSYMRSVELLAQIVSIRKRLPIGKAFV